MKRYFSSIKRYIWAIPICIVLGGLAGFTLGKALPVTYIATSTMLVDVNRPNTYIPGQQLASSDSLTRATNYSALITSRVVMNAVYLSDPEIKKRGYTVDDLLADVTATPSVTTATIAIAATTSNINDSMLLANDVSKGFQNYIQSSLQQRVDAEAQSLQTQIAAYQKQKQSDAAQIQAINNASDVRVGILQSDMGDATHNIDTLTSQLQQLPTTMQSDVFVVGLASPAGVTTSSKSSLLAAAASAVGLILGSLIMLILIFLDERLRGDDQVKEKLGLAYIGGLANNKEIKESIVKATGTVEQQLRDICINLRLTGVLPAQSRVHQGVVLLITSSRAAEGKTTLAVGLAASVARSGGTTVLVDGNLSNPTTHLAFGMHSAGPGLNGLLKSLGKETVDAAVLRTSIPGLWLLPGGKPLDGASLLLGQMLPAILAQLRQKTGLVIIDGPALLTGADASLMATMVDGVALVIDARNDKLQPLLRAKDILHSLTHIPAGVILNCMPRKRRNSYYATAYVGGTTTEKSKVLQLHSSSGGLSTNGNGNGKDVSNGQISPSVVDMPIFNVASSSNPPSSVPAMPAGGGSISTGGMIPPAQPIYPSNLQNPPSSQFGPHRGALVPPPGADRK